MRWLEQHWYRVSLLHCVLWPLSLVFAGLTALRRYGYRHGLFAVTRVRVPVVVAGNLSVGGTGKTPLVIALAERLRDAGLKPGIVCRGYGGSAVAPQRVGIGSDPRMVGDEAVLLARRTGCPVWAGRQRAAAAQALLAAHPECSVILSDDGLQHYAFARDVEIAVIDGERGFGNGLLLPAGPLREPRRRLARADAVVINGEQRFARALLPELVPLFRMSVGGSSFHGLPDPARVTGPAYFSKLRVHAIAAIGNPQRYFEHLRKLGISFIAHSFPDHHAFQAGELEFQDCDAVIMTEKDAVKCERFCNSNFWALRVNAEIDPALTDLILRKIGK